MTVTTDQFNQLKNGFIENVVKGDDIYQKTTPSEWSMFLKLVKNTAPYDYVLDGLNASYRNQSGGKTKPDDNLVRYNRLHLLIQNMKLYEFLQTFRWQAS